LHDSQQLKNKKNETPLKSQKQPKNYKKQTKISILKDKKSIIGVN